MTVDLGLATAQASAGDASGDVLANVENLIGSALNDRLSGNSLANDLADSADSRLPLEYYTRELLFSAEARAAWVEPDLKSLS